MKTSLGSISKHAARIKALELEIEIRTQMDSLPSYDCPSSAMTLSQVRQLVSCLTHESYSTIGKALDLLENNPAERETLRQRNQIQQKEGLPANGMYRIDLAHSPSLSAVNDVYASPLPPSKCTKNIMQQVQFTNGTPCEKALEQLWLKLTNLFALRLDARRALESLNLDVARQIHKQVALLLFSEEFVDGGHFDYSYAVRPSALSIKGKPSVNKVAMAKLEPIKTSDKIDDICDMTETLAGGLCEPTLSEGLKETDDRFHANQSGKGDKSSIAPLVEKEHQSPPAGDPWINEERTSDLAGKIDEETLSTLASVETGHCAQHPPECPEKYHIETILTAYEEEQIKLKALSSKKKVSNSFKKTLKRKLKRCRAVHELAGIVDVRKATRGLAIDVASLVISLPKDPLKTEHQALFEGHLRQEWPGINASLDDPIETLAQKTASDYFGSTSTIYNWASEFYDADGIQNNWKGIIKKKLDGQNSSEDRFAMNAEDLKMVFGHEVFSKGQLGINSRTKMACPYQYWLPLLTLFNAIRGNEGAQLYRDDIIYEFGIPYINVDDKREDQHIKNAHSRRKVPVHSLLIELGFLDYVNLFEPEQRIFPELSYHQNDKYFKNAGDWFSRTFKGAYSIKPEKKSFYSLRHNCVGFFKDHVGDKQPVVKALVGHTNASITFDTYGNKVALELLVEQLEKLEYDGFPEHIVPFFEGNYLRYHKEHREKYRAMKSESN
ncbi:site-specific integrase [Vibrio breoganii]|uniref:site-specific integrase n=1 Tax=Vibrio breoganii TaxID=553239 RepID=UPI0021C3CB64|nr:site-specific integrase [Vibrio breoganii]MDN3717966.1 site-specific integrase [Vibrio breoganii]